MNRKKSVFFWKFLQVRGAMSTSEALKVEVEQWEALPFDDILYNVPGSFEGFDSFTDPSDTKSKRGKNTKNQPDPKYFFTNNNSKIGWTTPKSTAIKRKGKILVY